MEIKINREIREYKENMFFGLSLRQLIFSLLACGVAEGIYLGRPAVLPSVFISVCGMCWVRKRSAGCVSSARLPLLPWAL